MSGSWRPMSGSECPGHTEKGHDPADIVCSVYKPANGRIVSPLLFSKSLRLLFFIYFPVIFYSLCPAHLFMLPLRNRCPCVRRDVRISRRGLGLAASQPIYLFYRDLPSPEDASTLHLHARHPFNVAVCRQVSSDPLRPFYLERLTSADGHETFNEAIKTVN